MIDPATHGETSSTATPGAGRPPTSTPPQPSQAEIDDGKAIACYANFCRITGTPEELLMDFGLNPLPDATRARSVKVDQRIVISPLTAKRLLQALQMSVQRHESVFGVLETDVQKRVRRS